MKKILMIIVCAVLSIGTIACTKQESSETNNDGVKEEITKEPISIKGLTTKEDLYNVLLKRIGDQFLFYDSVKTGYSDSDSYNYETHVRYVNFNNYTLETLDLGDIKNYDKSQLTKSYIEGNYYDYIKKYEIVSMVNKYDSRIEITLLPKDSSSKTEYYVIYHVDEDYLEIQEPGYLGHVIIKLYFDNSGVENEKQNDINETNKKAKPQIGMTGSEVKNTKWGYPDKINKDTYSWGTTEQWVYDDYGYVYFENGIVTSVSER